MADVIGILARDPTRTGPLNAKVECGRQTLVITHKDPYPGILV